MERLITLFSRIRYSKIRYSTGALDYAHARVRGMSGPRSYKLELHDGLTVERNCRYVYTAPRTQKSLFRTGEAEDWQPHKIDCNITDNVEFEFAGATSQGARCD